MTTLFAASPSLLLLTFVQLGSIVLMLVFFLLGLVAVLYRWFADSEPDRLRNRATPQIAITKVNS